MLHRLALLTSMALGATPTLAAEQITSRAEFCKAMRASQTGWQALNSRLFLPAQGFATALYQRVAAQATGNLAISPFSIDAAIAMTSAGARGETLAEMAKAMNLLSPPDAAWHADMGAFIASLSCPAEHRSRQMDIANRLFIQKGKALVPAFVDLLKNDYDAAPGEVDFIQQTEAARQTINGWVGKATREKIKNLVPPKLLTPDARVVLVNAVFLADRWAAEFPAANTKKRPFHLSAATTVEAPMMYRQGGNMDMSYAEMPGFRAVALKTADHATTMLVLVPSEVEGLAKLERSFDGAMLVKTISSLKSQKVNLTLPKFKVSGELGLKETLRELGIKRLFDPKAADLSGIDGGKDQLYVAAALHQAVIDVNEKGFEAAAATAVMAFKGAVLAKPTPPVDVVVDRPFLFVVMDSSSKVPLFMGRVVDPRT
jgi:serpin B